MTAPSPTDRQEPPARSPLLRRVEQSFIALVTFVSLCVLAVSWLAMNARPGGVIEIDRAPRHSVEFVVDVNSADWPELMLLPDIGETLARRIVDSREAAGAYHDLDDLQRVRGIGPKTVDRIRPYLLPLPDAEAMVGK